MKDLSQASSAVLYVPQKLKSLVEKSDSVSIDDTAKIIQRIAHIYINKTYGVKDGDATSEDEAEQPIVVDKTLKAPLTFNSAIRRPLFNYTSKITAEDLVATSKVKTKGWSDSEDEAQEKPDLLGGHTKRENKETWKFAQKAAFGGRDRKRDKWDAALDKGKLPKHLRRKEDEMNGIYQKDRKGGGDVRGDEAGNLAWRDKF